MADRWHLFENASAAFLVAIRSELPRLRKVFSPETPVDPETLSKAERIQWEGAATREAVNEQILAVAAQGIPLKAIARTTGLSRQIIRKIVRGQRHDVFRTCRNSLDPWLVLLKADAASEWNSRAVSWLSGSGGFRARDLIEDVRRIRRSAGMSLALSLT